MPIIHSMSVRSIVSYTILFIVLFCHLCKYEELYSPRPVEIIVLQVHTTCDIQSAYLSLQLKFILLLHHH